MPNEPIKQGYQLTEIGVIPDDWEVKIFDEIVEIRREKINPKTKGEGDYCIELEHIKSNSGTLTGFTITSLNSSIKNCFYEKDILFCKLRSYLRKYFFADRKGLCSTEIWVFKTKNNYIPKFVYQLVQTDKFIEYATMSYGTRMPRADWNIIKNLKIPVPPIEEQEKIAQVLTDIDDLIESLEKLINKKRLIKKGAMQELLTGERRLKGFGENKGYKQTELGLIPEDWNISFLKNIVVNNKIPSGLYKEQKEYGNGIKIIKIGDVFSGYFLDTEKMQKVNISKEELHKYTIMNNDIIIALASVKLEGVGKVLFVESLNEIVIYDHNVAMVRVLEKYNSKYIFYFLQSSIIRNLISNLATQVGTTFLKTTSILNFSMLLPTKEEQESIAQILTDMDKEIEGLEEKLEKYKQIKQGMMEELLTGKIRL